MPLQPSARDAPHYLDIFPASSAQYLALAGGNERNPLTERVWMAPLPGFEPGFPD
jgi:hypothetical protein